MSNRLTEKSDVYSFGVVLLEIITSKSAVVKINEEEKVHIGKWVESLLAEGDIRSIVDTRLQGDFEMNSVWKAVEIALACVSGSASKRPTMNMVVIELNECLATAMGKSNAVESTYSTDHMMMSMDFSTDLNPSAR